MENSSMYLIVAFSVGVVLVTIYISVMVVKKKMIKIDGEAAIRQKRMEEMEQAIYRRIASEEAERKKKLSDSEQKFNKRMMDAEANLLKRENELQTRIEIFNREQDVRSSVADKTDREVLVDMHVKEMHILNALNSIFNKIEGVNDYSQKLKEFDGSMKNRVDQVNSTVDGVKQSLMSSVAFLENSMKKSFGDMDVFIERSISNNMNAIDEEDIRSAVVDALAYDTSSYMDNFAKELSNRIQSGDIDWRLSKIESQLSDIQEIQPEDLDWRLSNIESQLSDIQNKLDDIYSNS